MMLQVCFSSANIYLFGMMKGRSTLIVKTNTISTKAAYVNTAAAWWWMSCKWCQHLFLTMMTPNPTGVMSVQTHGCTSHQLLWFMEEFWWPSLSQSLFWLLLWVHSVIYSFIHSELHSQLWAMLSRCKWY